MGAKREPGVQDPGKSGPRTRGKRQADRSDVRHGYARFNRARSGVEPMDKRTGASPSCPSRLLKKSAGRGLVFDRFA